MPELLLDLLGYNAHSLLLYKHAGQVLSRVLNTYRVRNGLRSRLGVLSSRLLDRLGLAEKVESVMSHSITESEVQIRKGAQNPVLGPFRAAP